MSQREKNSEEQPESAEESPVRYLGQEGKPLHPSAREALQGCLSDLRDCILIEANKHSDGSSIDEDDVYRAYKRLQYPTKDSLQFADSQAVISLALRENRFFEFISYSMAVVLFLAGLTLLAIGAFVSDVATRVGFLVSGSIVEVMILIPFRFAINSRRHNIALRMLGMIINRVDDPKKIAPLLKDTFLAVVVGDPQFNTTNKK